MDKIYADKQGRAVFRCPHCGFERSFDASAYRERDSRMKIKCRCGESVPVLIEFREYYRKSVNLLGQCLLHKTGELIQIRLHDLSLHGFSFSPTAQPVSQAGIEIEDVITIQFYLDNQARDYIERRAVVRNIRSDRIGAGFSRAEYDKVLGFYLMR